MAWPAWVVQLIVYLAATVITARLNWGKAPGRDVDLSEFSAPTISENRGIPVLFGRRWLRAPNWNWYGDVSIEVITQNGGRKYAFFGPREKIPIGEKWSTGAHLTFCYRLDRLLELRAGEVDDPMWAGNVSANTLLEIDEPELFGGEKKGGGVVGQVAVMFGRPDQAANAYLDAQTGGEGIAYRDEFGLVLEHVYVGTQRWIEAWMALGECTSTESGWYQSRAAVGPDGDMNAAHIIYETLTSRTWARLGYSPSEIDDASFRAAADTLHAEGFGLSIEFGNDQMTARQFIAEICRHVDGNVFEDPATGLWTFTLNRDDYDPDDIPLIDDSNSAVRSCSVRVPEVTTVVVAYEDRDLRRERYTAPDTDLAAVQLLGGEVAVVDRYPGIATAELATRVCARERAQQTRQLIECEIDAFGPAADDLIPGRVFRWRPSKLGYDVVMRVLRADLGNIDQRGRRIRALQALPEGEASTYAPPPPSGWVDPIQAPVPSPQRLVMESPYQVLLADQLGPEAAGELDDDMGVCLVAAAAPGGGVSQHEVWTRVGASGAFAQAVPFGQFAGFAELGAGVGPATTLLPIVGAIGRDKFIPGRLAAVVDGGRIELVLVEIVTASAITVKRGMVDTTPAPIAAGAKLFSLADTTTYIDDARAAGQTVQVRVLTESPKGKLPLSGAPTDSLTFASRQVRPYPPGRLRINGQAYPGVLAGASITAQVAHRDRLAQGANLVDQDAASIGPEPGTTLTFRWYLGGALVRTEAGVTGTSDTFTPAGSGTVRVEVEAVRDGHASWQALAHQFSFEVTP
ncbi:hypothetical protein BGP89_11400 [Luteimonas sp. JM171]|uniref:hypothetical protein n=1 Tax=Luteimonas sp. JM171 TaxID=1896164 RepID=UPI00085542D4|nr:hypothetical protein [Luteimonas sp. JM171]AOH36885.1 hypothetical protein BGP89_11400 [Luteimonas sp. JM171]